MDAPDADSMIQIQRLSAAGFELAAVALCGGARVRAAILTDLGL
jgi:hypothetical protein